MIIPTDDVVPAYCLLPNPVWKMIFQQSSIHSLLNMSMVSRKMYFQLLDTDYFVQILKDNFIDKPNLVTWAACNDKAKVRSLLFASQNKYGCLGCGKIDLNGLIEHEMADLAICSACSCSERFRMITATNAKKDYRLSQSEIDDLQCVTKRNPHYRNAAPMRLFWEAQVSELSNKKHASKKTTLSDAKRKSELAGQKRANTKEMKRLARRKILQDALDQWGLSIRADSQLCESYLTEKWGSIDPMTPQQVALRMRTMHILHTHTKYQEKVSEAIKLERHGGYIPRDEFMAMIRVIKHNVESEEMLRWNETLKHNVACLCNPQ